MTRFARALGSKGSNKKSYEEASSWQEMDVKSNKKKSLKNNDKSPQEVNKIENKNENTKDDVIIENGIKFKVFKKQGKKQWFDLPYQENDVMTRYKNFYVKKEMVKVLDDFKKTLEEQGLDKKQISNKMLTKERRAHKALRLELLRNEIENANKDNKNLNISKYLGKKFKKQNIIIEKSTNDEDKMQDSSEKQNETNKKKSDFKFEENELMTFYEGYWIFRESVSKLEAIHRIKIERIIKNRQNGLTDAELSSEEELLLRRLMKKEKRRENRMLKLHLAKQPNKVKKNVKKRPGRYLGIEYKPENDMVKFDGFWIKKEAADRLYKMKEKLKSSGCSEEEISKIVKNERRKEERILKNDKKLFCFQCRRVGHMISSCPNGGDLKEGVEICFKCGSTEHMARSCPSNIGSSFDYAVCFICNERGHISRECPDNPKGLYPNGGSCNECGSVEHLRRDCPELQKSNDVDTIRLATYNSKLNSLDSIEEEDHSVRLHEPKKKKLKKTILF